jgi:hypothetical protein
MSCFNLYCSSSVQTNNIFYLIVRKISNTLVHVFIIVTLIFPEEREREIVQLIENISPFYFAFATC